ncbi:MAG: hypothetical protein AB7G93_17385 [Bdellovibrionales bacterium]
MKTSRHWKWQQVVLGILLAAIYLPFQNCSQVSFTPANEASKMGDPDDQGPRYAELRAGDEANFPPLKMAFIVDNSGTMQANQISLSKAFSKMFSGDNATNLAPFDSTAYLISTAQMSLLKGQGVYAKLPKQALSEFEALSLNQLMSGPRADKLNGQIPGDLVGYRVLEQTSAEGLDSVSYLPAPVARFDDAGNRSVASIGIRLKQRGSVADFASDFEDRISILDPARSEMDPVQRVGILDSVVDRESGLCALARMLRHSDQFFKPGDIGAFVIVSDENDQDPKGLNCIESVKEYTGAEDLIDGYCVTPKTELSYRDLNPNPTKANCTVAFDTGFTYKYSYGLPSTDVSYFLLQRDYSLRRTLVHYSTATHTYRTPKTIVSYFTKAPTYKLPQTTIKYFKKVESCDVRDGVKFNCTYTFPSFTTAPFATAYSGNCSAFAEGKLPADALRSDPAHPITCQSLAPIAKSGACNPADPNVLECKQNYSSARKDSAPLAGSVTSTCAAFAAGKLEASAVYTDAGYEVQCRDASVTAGPVAGLCPTDGSKESCVNSVNSASTTVDGVPTAWTAAACMSFGAAKKASLPDVILNNASYPLACSEAESRRVVNVAGACPTSDINIRDCVQHPASTATSRVLTGEPAQGQSCVDFISKGLGSVKIDPSRPVSCSLSAQSQIRTVTNQVIQFSNPLVSGHSPTVNGSCPNALMESIADTLGVASLSSCTVTAINRGTYAYNQGKTCEQLDSQQHCTSSGGLRRNCIATSTLPGDPYMATRTIATFSGEFSCNTLCSQTSFCKSEPGTVGDNFKDCAVTPRPVKRGFVDAAAIQQNLLCNKTGENPVAVITKGPYQVTGPRTEYVAGELTEQGLPDALAQYIRDSSKALFGQTLPALSVFVRQNGDPLGTNGSLGAAYLRLADLMDGQKRSVLSDASGYAEALKSLSELIREKLDRSFSINVAPGQYVRRVWHRKAGETEWGLPLDESVWTASGGTVTLAPGYSFAYGDEFRFEYY